MLLYVLLATILVLLVHLVFLLAHLLSHLNTELLAFLVPAPLIYLSLAQASIVGNQLEGLFGPAWLLIKLVDQLFKLLSSLALAFTDDTFFLPRLLVEVIAAAGGTSLSWCISFAANLFVVAGGGLVSDMLRFMVGWFAGALIVANVIFSVLL